MTTRKRIEDTIYKETGHRIVVAGNYMDEGCYFFACDTDDDLADHILNDMGCGAVYVNALNHQSLESWVNDFLTLIQNYTGEPKWVG